MDDEKVIACVRVRVNTSRTQPVLVMVMVTARFNHSSLPASLASLVSTASLLGRCALSHRDLAEKPCRRRCMRSLMSLPLSLSPLINSSHSRPPTSSASAGIHYSSQHNSPQLTSSINSSSFRHSHSQPNPCSPSQTLISPVGTHPAPGGCVPSVLRLAPRTEPLQRVSDAARGWLVQGCGARFESYLALAPGGKRGRTIRVPSSRWEDQCRCRVFGW